MIETKFADIVDSEAVAQKYSINKIVLKFSQNSQKNISDGTFLQWPQVG